MGNVFQKENEVEKEVKVYGFNNENAKKIRQLVKDPESGYQRNPVFSEIILLPKTTTRVISSDEEQYFHRIPKFGWSITELDFGKHLSVSEYIKKYCEFKQFEQGSEGETLWIPVYTHLS